MSEVNPYTPEVDPQNTLYADAFQIGRIVEQPYEPNKMLSLWLSSPGGSIGNSLGNVSYNTAKEVLDAYNNARNPITKALVLSGISNELRENEQEMIKIISKIPEAIRMIDQSRRDTLCNIITEAPNAYSALDSNMQQSQDIIDAYVEGFRQNGCHVEDRVGGEWYHGALYCMEPDESLMMPNSLIDPNCPIEKFFSVENYQKSYEQILRDGAPQYGCRGSSKDFGQYPAYSSDSTFCYMAQIACGDNERMKDGYQWAMAQAIVNNIGAIAKKIEKNPTWKGSQDLAVAVAIAAHTLEHPPATLVQSGVAPQPEKAAHIVSAIEQAEKQHWIGKGQEAIISLQELSLGRELQWWAYQEIDVAIEQSATRPEMGISTEIQEKWWKLRCDHFEMAKAGDKTHPLWYLEELSSRHPEMRLGEQLVIDEFNNEEQSHEDFDGPKGPGE
jgi:hypothetical protein